MAKICDKCKHNTAGGTRLKINAQMELEKDGEMLVIELTAAHIKDRRPVDLCRKHAIELLQKLELRDILSEGRITVQ